ncbi:MAG: patatin-like phospholipase family protein [Betaproteobacteria bacterium]|nr:patatin-like phospholipase family protein [Betaproteobacteria bacterium]MDH4325429.1 patatin-like phospholipase family protein [Betaproteobacteria bacterium]MDH5211034.1 patatin-like phospholipase family protein [Betaproteobacteria bacterium]MDH5579090.1 patatin-like phospholipase family protein [Betaproteobacteria bacterium]
MKRRQFLAVAAGLALAKSAAGKPDDQGVSLVLGGGGCRGYGHLGVLRVLERERLRPDLVVGASSGALVGALFAAGMPVDEIERYGGSMSLNLLRNWVFPKLGIFGGERIRRFVVERVGEKRIEALPMRFAAVATDLKSGEMVVLDSGDLGRAVQASSSVPGLLEPVRIGKRLLVDGNIASAVPVRAARRLGAKRVVAVDVTFPPEQADLSDPFDALYQGFSILTRKLALEERATADVMIEPPIPEHNDMSPATLKAMVDAGERGALAALPRLRALFAAR